MATTSYIYNSFKELFAGGLDLEDQTYGALLTIGYTPDISNEEMVSEISADEISGTNYSRQNLQNIELIRDDINNRIQLSADDITWESAIFSADAIVIYINAGNDTTSNLVACFKFGEVKSSDNTDFIIEWSDEQGILMLG